MTSIRLLPLAIVLVAACLAPKNTATELPAPTTSRTYDNAAEPEDPTCYHTGPCDHYELTFPAKQRVHIELRSAQMDTVLLVRRGGFGEDLEAHGTPEAPAVIDLVDGGAETVRILAASSDSSSGLGDYQLVVGPEPIAEVALPTPKIPWETREATLLAEHPVLPGFAMTEKQAKAPLHEALAGLAPVALGKTASLDGFAPVDIPVEAGYCYRVAYQLADGARYSELATRGLSGWVETPDHKGLGTDRLLVLGSHAVAARFCAYTSGDAQLTLEAELAPRNHATEIGTGEIALSLYREPFWPGLRSKDELGKLIRQYTKGHAAGGSFELDLASTDTRALKVKRGKCYVLVFRLAKGASWSASAQEQGIGIDFQGDDEDLSAGPGLIGPGAVSAIGCPQRSQTYQMKLVAYGQDATVGAGKVTAQLYVRSARKGELGQLARDEDTQIRQDNADAARRKEEHCAKCRKDNDGDRAGLEACAAQWYERDACY